MTPKSYCEQNDVQCGRLLSVTGLRLVFFRSLPALEIIYSADGDIEAQKGCTFEKLEA